MSIYSFWLAIIQVCVAVYYIVTRQRIALIILTAILVVSTVFYGFLVFHGDPEEKAFLESFNSQEVRSSIENYLDVTIGEVGFGGKVFCSYELLGARSVEDRAEVYVWTVCEEYYVKDGALAQGTGVSQPVAIIFKNGIIVGHKEPSLASYSQDIKTMFPSDVQGRISRMSGRPDFETNNRAKAQVEFKVNQ